MKVGVLGCGTMGKIVLGHFKDIREVTEVVVCDLAEDRLRAVKEEFKDQFHVSCTTRLSDILDDKAIKAVFVVTPNYTHKDLTLELLHAGKAVLCEKPIANTLADARLMVETAERLNAFFQVGFELRYSLLYMKVKEWIDAGLLGQVVNTHCLYCSSTNAKSAWRNLRREGGNTFGERLSHYVDLTRWWVGSPVTEVYSACSPNVVPYIEVHDNYHTTYRFRSGAVSHISFYNNYPALFRGDPLAENITDLQLGDGHKLRYIVVGTKGAAETDVFHRRIKRWQFSDSPETMVSDWVENLTWDPKDDYIHYHNTTHQTRDVVRRVASGLPPATPARDAYETMRLCFAAEKSADESRCVRLDEFP